MYVREQSSSKKTLFMYDIKRRMRFDNEKGGGGSQEYVSLKTKKPFPTVQKAINIKGVEVEENTPDVSAVVFI
jgi:hypothetical protein